MSAVPSWRTEASGRIRRFLLLSVLLHLLLLVLLPGRRGQESNIQPVAGQRPMQVTLSRSKSAAPPTVPAAAPVPVPPEPGKAKPARRSPERLAVRKPQRPAARRPVPAEPPVPEFRDDFAERSHTYSRESPEAGQTESAELAGDGALGISPGSIANINPRIVYPKHAQMSGQQGIVVVLIHIGTDGSALRVDLVHSSGYAELDEQVLGAVQHWRFIPPRRGHMPVESTYKHTVVFGAEERIDDFDRHWREIRLMPAS